MIGESQVSMLASDWRGNERVLRISENVASTGRTPGANCTAPSRTTPSVFGKWGYRTSAPRDPTTRARLHLEIDQARSASLDVLYGNRLLQPAREPLTRIALIEPEPRISEQSATRPRVGMEGAVVR